MQYHIKVTAGPEILTIMMPSNGFTRVKHFAVFYKLDMDRFIVMNLNVLIFINFLFNNTFAEVKSLYDILVPRYFTRQNCLNEYRAVSCSLVKIDFSVLNGQYLLIPEEPFHNLIFYRTLEWHVGNICLKEYEIKNDGHYGYLTVLYNEKNLYGNFEYKGYKYSIMPYSIYQPGVQIIFRWEGKYQNEINEMSRNLQSTNTEV